MEEGTLLGNKEGGARVAGDGRKFALSMGREGSWKVDEEKRKR